MNQEPIGREGEAWPNNPCLPKKTFGGAEMIRPAHPVNQYRKVGSDVTGFSLGILSMDRKPLIYFPIDVRFYVFCWLREPLPHINVTSDESKISSRFYPHKPVIKDDCHIGFCGHGRPFTQISNDGLRLSPVKVEVVPPFAVYGEVVHLYVTRIINFVKVGAYVFEVNSEIAGISNAERGR